MLRGVILVLSVLASSLAQSGSPPGSPCPAVFRYSYSPSQGWHGIVSIVPPLTFSEVLLKLRLSVAKYKPDAGVGKVDILGGDTEVQNIANRASNKQRQKIQYIVVFPSYEQFPRISSVKINEYEFCPSPAYSGARGVINLEYTLETGLAVADSNGTEFSVDGANIQPEQPAQQQPQKPQQPQQQQTQPPQQWQQPVQTPQNSQQPNIPDTIACVGDKDAHQMTTGCPHQHGNTDSFVPSRPKTTLHPQPRPKPTSGDIVFPDSSQESSGEEVSNHELSSVEKRFLVDSFNVNIGSITRGGSVNVSGIEKHLEALETLLQPISKSAVREESKSKENAKVEVEYSYYDEDESEN